MRRKIVLWGSNEKDEKILVALELLERENLVNIYTFPQNLATEQFYRDMSEKWRDDKDIDFPDGYTKIERKLSISDSLLPDEIKVEKTDIITRAQAEWHFLVLSSKLYELYKTELEEIKEKIDAASNFEGSIWDDLKSFWGKVQDQVNDRNLFREHGAALREKTNGLFDKLKELRKTLEAQVDAKSKEFVNTFMAELKEIEDKIDQGLAINPIFEELKKIQAKINDFEFTRKDRDKVWNKIDESFKKLKEKRAEGRSGGGQSGTNNSSQLTNRYNGLIAAIQKMQKSIDMDKKDLEFENKRIEKSDGQLESMLRQAKINMIHERIASKEEKIADMHKTKTELEARIERDKEREKDKSVKAEKAAKLEEAKELVKAKIAAEIEENKSANESMADALEAAANDLSKSKKKNSDSTLLGTLAASVSELVENVSDAAEAVADVVSEKLEDAIDIASDVIDKVEDNVDTIADKVEDTVEDSKVGQKMETISDTIEDAIDKIKDSIVGENKKEVKSEEE
jgi:chromosome segregation ATPase